MKEELQLVELIKKVVTINIRKPLMMINQTEQSKFIRSIAANNINQNICIIRISMKIQVIAIYEIYMS